MSFEEGPLGAAEPPADAKPLIVQRDRTVLLDLHAPGAEAAWKATTLTGRHVRPGSASV